MAEIKFKQTYLRKSYTTTLYLDDKTMAKLVQAGIQFKNDDRYKYLYFANDAELKTIRMIIGYKKLMRALYTEVYADYPGVISTKYGTFGTDANE